jgi:integrase
MPTARLPPWKRLRTFPRLALPRKAGNQRKRKQTERVPLTPKNGRKKGLFIGAHMAYIPDDTLEAIKELMRARGKRYDILLRFGIETGLRISDILNIKIRQIKRTMDIMQIKTKTKKHCQISAELWRDIWQYKVALRLSEGDYLFHSTNTVKDRPLTRVQVYRVFRAIRDALDIKEFGPHSMRKTYARNLYRETKDIKAVQAAMGHKYVETTMRYFIDFSKLEV